jgi:hypothetical protein
VTYLISGEIYPASGMNTVRSQGSGDTMNTDTDPYAFTPSLAPKPNFGFANGSKQDEGDLVAQVRLTVVGEAELEGEFN